MRKKPCFFPPVHTRFSPTPTSPASASSCDISHGHWQAPTSTARPPRQTRFPSLTSKLPPHLRACKAYGLQVILEVSSSPCPAIPSSPPDLHPVLLESVPNYQSPYAPLPPSHLSLASGRPCRRRTRICTPPAQSPPPTISPLLGQPANSSQELESQPVGTQNSQRFMSGASTGRREHNRLGSCYR